MYYKIRILSSETDDFLMDVIIDGSSTFLFLHHCIQKQLGYDQSQLASFFITDPEWNKEKEITLIDMSDESLQNDDLLVMDKTIIADYISEIKQRMLYTFDLFADRAFFMEVFGVENDPQPHFKVLTQNGVPPEQMAPETMDFNSLATDDYSYDEDDDDDIYRYDGELDEDNLYAGDYPDEDF